MRHGIVNGKKNILRILIQKRDHLLSGPSKRFILVSQRSRITDRGRKYIKREFTTAGDKRFGDLVDFIDIFPRKGVNKYRPRIVPIIFYLLF
jgi:hypothetical protein